MTLHFSGYSYERLDGSVRGEERYLAIQNFNDTDDTFIFLLSTRAGGQGLNLMSADTVIFVDSDFNPQNDLQAAARAHRIGQTRPVKIIRLVTRSTVEEIVLKRADEKLKLTNAVIENGKFSGGASAVNQIAETPTQLADLLKFGLDKLSESQESAATERDLERILGGSCDNRWIVEQKTGDESIGKADDDVTSPMQIDNDDENVENMYVYESRDYSKETNDRDQQAFDNMVAEMLTNVQSEETILRGDERKQSIATNYFDPPATRKRKVPTPEELEERRRKREENALKRAKLQEEAEVRREIERQRKLEKLWKDYNYVSLNTALDDDDDDDVDEESDALDEDDDSERKDIQYVRGDVTHPINTRSSDAIIVHCVDDSGCWGKGGLFSTLSRRSSQPETRYELAGKMKDLNLGDAHLIQIDDQDGRKDGHDYVALIVAQSRDRKNQLSAILLTSLSEGLRRVSLAAKRMNATVHLPRLGYNTPSFNWYGTERLIRKHLASKGIETSIYYYARRHQVSSGSLTLLASASNAGDPTSTQNRKKNLKDDSPAGVDFRGNLPNFMRGVNVFFFNVDEDEKKKLTRYLVAYDGEVSHFACQSVTHVVCDKQADTSITFEDWMVGVKIVSSKWLVKCFKKGRQVDTRLYEIENS
ncbi:chromodomain-helicase-DNA-binding protein 1-like [Acropora millepora]|uniref:chromodomain-helicase-DNA-binding protein 1-like n=1 Tax=Acropora millepora TaxID=45264 RepID=UPI001CF2EA99|nr:chromodomain-helicase-DNA-binding protein 1-like [Acropora millepora]